MARKPELACKSYRRLSTVCADGFVQRAICAGDGVCHSCGSVVDKYLPHCVQDEAPAHLVNDDGSPIFYRPKAASGGQI